MKTLLTLFLLAVLVVVVYPKRLKVTTIEDLRGALVAEGLEMILGDISDRRKDAKTKKVFDDLAKRLNDPIGRYQRSRCNPPNERCTRCLNTAKLNAAHIGNFMGSQLSCNLNIRRRNNCACTISDALFFMNAKTVSNFATIPLPGQKITAFVASYIPSYFVDVTTKVGSVVRDGEGRTSNLTVASDAFSQNLFEFGQRYVGCVSIKYTTKSSGKQVLSFYSCQEFTLNIYDTSSLYFLFQLYEQANKEKTTEVKNTKLASIFAMMKEFMQVVDDNEVIHERLMRFGRILADIARQKEMPAALKKSKDFYTSRSKSYEDKLVSNNAKLDSIIMKIAEITERQANTTEQSSTTSKQIKSAVKAVNKVSSKAVKKAAKQTKKIATNTKKAVRKAVKKLRANAKTLSMSTRVRAKVGQGRAAGCTQQIVRGVYRVSASCAPNVRILREDGDD